MGFPRTAVLDDFNRADGDLGANWQEFMRSGNDFVIASNQAKPDGDEYNGELYNVAQYGPACEVYATLATLQSAGGIVVLYARLKDVVADDWNFDGYALQAYWFEWEGTDYFRFYVLRIDDSVATTLGATVTYTDHANGDKAGLRCVGAALEAWRDDGGGWALIAQRSDSTYGAAGYVGLYMDKDASRVDDFGGGTIKPVASMWHHYAHH